MKYLSLIILSLFFIEFSYAKQVDEKTALIAANNYYNLHKRKISKSQSNSQVPEIRLVTGKIYFRKSNNLKNGIEESDIPAIYVFINPEYKGFVITSAETSFPPVLGYSDESTFNPENLPAQLESIIERWMTTFSYTIHEPELMELNEGLWNELITGGVKKDNLLQLQDIEPMLKTKWGQGQYYNDQCPLSQGQRTKVGCVATAVSQIMKYWNYPENGTGKVNYDYSDYTVSGNLGDTRYDWANMPEILTSANPSVSTLCFHVGAAISMIYGVNESTGVLNFVPLALKENFNYDGNAKYYPDNFQPLHIDTVKNTIKRNLLKGCPVLIGASDSLGTGHAYVCDGLQNELFHINFGWSGYADGYYNLTNDIKYNRSFRIVVNIKPKSNGIWISDKKPMTGQIVKVKFSTVQTDPVWKITPESNVTILKDASDPKLFYLTFTELADYKISLYSSDVPSAIADEALVKVTFSLFKDFTAKTSLACGQSEPVRWFDYDNDGDLDLYLSKTGYLYKNDRLVFNKIQYMGASYNGSFQVFDYNNDSFLDVVKTEPGYVNGKYAVNIFIFKNMAGLRFEKQSIVLPSLGGGGIVPRDFNNDGNMDLFIYGNDYESVITSEYDLKTTAVVLINQITSFEKIFETNLSSYFRSENLAAGLDIENDGDMDIVLRSSDNTCKIIENVNGTFIEKDINISGYFISSADMDNNGTSDLVTTFRDSGYPYGKIMIQSNNNGQFTKSEFITDRAFGYARIGMSDFNCDGNNDLVITRTVESTKWVGLNLFLSKNGFTYISDIGTDYVGPDIDCGDFNNDGYPDIVIGTSVLLNSKGSAAYAENTPPTAPTKLISTPGGGKSGQAETGVLLVWEKSSDQQTPVNGLSYNIVIGTTPGGIDIISPKSEYPTGKRKVVEPGNAGQSTSYEVTGLAPGKYYWSVQAVDNGYVGGPFAAIQSFEVLSTPTGVGIVKTDQSLIVYPNPVHDRLTIENDSNFDESDFEIFNSFGQVICKGKLSGKVTLQTAHYAPGIYMVRLTAGNRYEYVKIVKR